MPYSWVFMMPNHQSKPTVFVAGSTGMVGSAIVRRLRRDDYPVEVGPTPRIDLCEQSSVRGLLDEMKPRWVILAAARVGGIKANSTYPADFIYTNLAIQTNVLQAAYECGVEKLLFLGSSCIYPKYAAQPIKEEYLLTGPLEPTNEPYAVAKIAGIIMAQSYNRQYGTNFISVMPTNLFGPNDNFDLDDSHVVPALLRKTHEAKVAGKEFVEVWGSGKARREFLHVYDLADACVFLMENYDSSEIINIGTGVDTTIRELALITKEVVGYTGEIRFDTSMPDGTPRKLLDVSRLNALGWRPSMTFRQGLEATYQWYLENEENIRK